MIRLTILTLLGLFAVLALLGDRDPERPFNPATEEAAPAAEAAPVETVVEAAAPAVPAEEVAQTPEQVQTFPGPPLRPSPEHAGEAETELAEAEALAAGGAEIMYVTGDRVNFRAGPSTNDRVIGAILRGSPVEILGQTEGWVQLRDAGGREGYMSLQFLSPERPN
ncbi:SH3 domain-containing protein [uncultured Paracoccus sp.]|uniref:SH3 domain-containing protein n=1 Tax=uncultured Paracoccus sp. TaxID=189685 RepID=UPI00260A3A8C|nr:SH3 domain-containing protein [uncultured Paracoccus sp.]